MKKNMEVVFELKEEHITLLQNAIVEWEDCETGAPAINPKKPYGNSNVASDVASILRIDRKTCPHCGEILDEKEGLEEKLMKLHQETETALQIILQHKTFEPGLYVAEDDWGRSWRKKQER